MGEKLNAKLVVGIGVLAFLIPFLGHTGYGWWEWVRGPELRRSTCEYNLKALWFLSRRFSQHFQSPFPPPSFEAVKAYVMKREPVMMTRQLAKYLGLEPLLGLIEGVYWTFGGPILVCDWDPKYLLKMAQMQQWLDFQSSYRWRPDARTLAECPYCRIAVLLDGRIEKRP